MNRYRHKIYMRLLISIMIVFVFSGMMLDGDKIDFSQIVNLACMGFFLTVAYLMSKLRCGYCGGNLMYRLGQFSSNKKYWHTFLPDLCPECGKKVD